MNNNYLIFNDLGILDFSDIKEVSQGNHNVDYYFIGYHDYDYTNSYVSTAVTLPNGTNMPELATSLKEFEFNGVKYKGFMFKLPETLTSIAGNLTITMVLSSLEDDTQLCSSQVNIPIHDTDTPTEPTITNAQYDNMLETISENFNEIERKIDEGMLKGDKGDKGDVGETGEAATITVGEVKTVQSNQPAKVINVGTNTNAIFDFEIPKGEGGLSKEDKNKLDSVEFNSQENRIENITLTDGEKIYPSQNKTLALPIPERVGVELEYIPSTGAILLKDQYGNMLDGVDLPLELIVNNGYYSEDSQEIILVLANGDKIVIPVHDLVNEYNADGTTIIKGTNNTFSVASSIVNKINTNADNISNLQSNQVTKADLNKKLDKTSYVVDSALNTASANPVQNQVVATALNSKPDKYMTAYKLETSFNEETNKLILTLYSLTNEALSEKSIDLSSLKGVSISKTSELTNDGDGTSPFATEEFVNSSIATNTATFRGTYTSVNDLPTTGVDINDYAFVVTTDSNGNISYNRYKYTTTWEYEYTLNNSSFTAAQWAAIQSGITAALVQQISTNTSNINNKANTSDLANYLPLTAGSSKKLTGDLYSTKDIILSNNQALRGKDTSGNNYRLLEVSATDNVWINYDNLGKTIVGGTAIQPFSANHHVTDLGIETAAFRNIRGKAIYQDGKQVANKEDIPDVSGKLTGTKFATNASFNTYLPYTESGSGNTTPTYVATFVSNSAKNGLTFSSVSNLKTQMGIPNFVTLTQAEYDALSTKDANTYYFIKEE